MRIGVITGSFLPNVGGMEWKVHHLTEGYARRGHDVTLFTHRPRILPGPVRLPVAPSYRIERSSLPIPGFGRWGLTRWLFRRAVLRHHRRRPFDVLQSHHLGIPTQIADDVKRITGLPVVATTCGGDVQVLRELGYGERLDPRIDRLVRNNLKRVDVVGSISSSMREALAKLEVAARVVDIPNGVAWDEFQTGPSRLLRDRLGLDDEGVLILSVGRNHPVKGYAHGIRAFARLASRHPSAHYALVGRQVQQLAPLVSEVGVGGRVHLVGPLPMAEMPAVFHSADVFFNPSLMEGFAQVNAQALACGLPCVLTDAPGNRDAAEGGGALVARSSDEASMAGALDRLLGDAALRGRLGREAHRASRRYAWESIAEQYLEILQSLANGKTRCRTST